jgi:hypothetical protein
MPPAIASAPPALVMQGDTLVWRFSSSDATPADATLSVRFVSPGVTVGVPGVADGAAWLVTATAAQTQLFGAGPLKWMARATYLSGQVTTLAAGTISVLGVAPLGEGSATQSHAARMVSLLEVQREKLAADVLDEYSVGDRTAKRRKLAEVEASLRAARRELSREENGGRLPSVRIVFPSFSGVTR